MREMPARDESIRDAERPYAEDGTDPTLIRWMLSLSPRDRLEVLQRGADSLRRLRDRVSSET